MVHQCNEIKIKSWSYRERWQDVGGIGGTILSFHTHRTESTSVETVVAFKAMLIRLSRTAQWHLPHWRHSTTA